MFPVGKPSRISEDNDDRFSLVGSSRNPLVTHLGKERCSAQGKMTVDNLKMTSEMTKLCPPRLYSLMEERIHKCM